MKKINGFITAPAGITLLLLFLIIVSTWTAGARGFKGLESIFSGIPQVLFLVSGMLVLAVWGPVLLWGSLSARKRNGSVISPELIRTGIYKYVRAPFCLGLSFTVFGLGLIINNPGIAIAGLLWMVPAVMISRIRERELLIRFGTNYRNYRIFTPMFFPYFDLMLQDFLGMVMKKERS
jgi:protein-S-isoprenylcysteine O-methyltransferase Ste14